MFILLCLAFWNAWSEWSACIPMGSFHSGVFFRQRNRECNTVLFTSNEGFMKRCMYKLLMHVINVWEMSRCVAYFLQRPTFFPCRIAAQCMMNIALVCLGSWSYVTPVSNAYQPMKMMRKPPSMWILLPCKNMQVEPLCKNIQVEPLFKNTPVEPLFRNTQLKPGCRNTQMQPPYKSNGSN